MSVERSACRSRPSPLRDRGRGRRCQHGAVSGGRFGASLRGERGGDGAARSF